MCTIRYVDKSVIPDNSFYQFRFVWSSVVFLVPVLSSSRTTLVQIGNIETVILPGTEDINDGAFAVPSHPIPSLPFPGTIPSIPRRPAITNIQDLNQQP